jgi:lipoprotein-releasing system permease protein
LTRGGRLPTVRALVKLPFSLFLALRYLKPKRTFVSVISFVSVFGVALGVWVMVIVLSVMTGFDSELRRKVLGFEAHLTVSSREGILRAAGPDVERDWEDLRAQINRVPGVLASSPFVFGPTVIDFEGDLIPAQLMGIDPETEIRITDFRGLVKRGALDLDGDKCVLGIELAASLGVDIGDRISLLGTGNVREVIRQLKLSEAKDPKARTLGEIRELIQPIEVEITGLFESGRYEYDSKFVLLPLHIAQGVYGFAGDVHGLSVRTKDADWAHGFRGELAGQLGPQARVTSWIDQNRQLFDAIAVERGTMSVILFVIVCVAAFAIMNTLITVTVQKRREIGVMKALGAGAGQIVRLFVYQGGIVGAIGIVAGLGAALPTLAFRNQFREILSNVLGLQILPKDVYQLSGLPAEIVPAHIAFICVASFAVCLVAGLIPAIFAARLDPVKALRSE